MNVTSLNKFHDAVEMMTRTKWVIDDVAARLHDVGLEKLCKPLWMACKDMEAAAKMVRDAASEAINDSVRDAERSSATMLAALFTGAAIKDPSLGDTALAFVSAAAHNVMTENVDKDEG